MARRGDSDFSTVVTWEAAVLIIGLLLIGIFAAPFFMDDPHKLKSTADIKSDHDMLVLFQFVSTICSTAILTAILSRLSKCRSRSQRWSVVGGIGNGLAMVMLAVIATVVLRHWSWGDGSGTRWFLFPTALYIGGGVLLANAMNPDAW